MSLTKQMAVEWTEYNIRVNEVSPGPLMTPRTAKIIEATKARIQNFPLGRVGNPKEIPSAIVFRASEDSSYMTGQVLVVDGGGVEAWWLYLSVDAPVALLDQQGDADVLSSGC